jgi:hypothetical protein
MRFETVLTSKRLILSPGFLVRPVCFYGDTFGKAVGLELGPGVGSLARLPDGRRYRNVAMALPLTLLL